MKAKAGLYVDTTFPNIGTSTVIFNPFENGTNSVPTNSENNNFVLSYWCKITYFSLLSNLLFLIFFLGVSITPTHQVYNIIIYTPFDVESLLFMKGDDERYLKMINRKGLKTKK